MPLIDGQKSRLTAALVGMGKHHVQISCRDERDCVELMHDLEDCFRDAGWDVADLPLSRSWGSAVAKGLMIFGKASQTDFNSRVMQEVVNAVGGAALTNNNLPDPDDNYPEIAIVIGPKRLRDD